MRNLLFTLLPAVAFCQVSVPITVQYGMPNSKNNIFSAIEVVDARKNSSPVTLRFKDKPYNYTLSPSFAQDMQKQFMASKKGTNTLVMYVEDITFHDSPAGDKFVPDAHLKIATFQKTPNGFRYLYSIDKDLAYAEVDAAKKPNNLSSFFTTEIADLLRATYSASPLPKEISIDQLPQYRQIITESLPAYNSALKDGIYLTGNDFFLQRPATGYTLKMEKEKVVGANTPSGEISKNKIAYYVENGAAFLNTYTGFKPLQKDESGYYVFSNKGELEQVAYNNTYSMFGLVGGLAGIAEQSAKQKKAKGEEKRKIYIDPLTNKYIY